MSEKQTGPATPGMIELPDNLEQASSIDFVAVEGAPKVITADEMIEADIIEGLTPRTEQGTTSEESNFTGASSVRSPRHETARTLANGGIPWGRNAGGAHRQ